MSGTGSSLNLEGSCYGASFTSNTVTPPVTPKALVHRDSNISRSSAEFAIEFERSSPSFSSNFLAITNSIGFSTGFNNIKATTIHTPSTQSSDTNEIKLEPLAKDPYILPIPFISPSESQLYNIDIENPLVWNNIPIEDKDNYNNKVSFIQKYRSNIPKEVELEYLSHHFYSSINLLRVASAMGIISIIYDGFQSGINTNLELIIIRIICLLMLFSSVGLSFLKNKKYYRRSYVPLFIVACTAYFLTFMLEYATNHTTLVLFLYAVLFCSLYALGCLMTRWIVTLNIVIGLTYIIFLASYKVLNNINLISYIIYIVLIFLIGSMNLIVLEQTRKDSFLDSKNLQKETHSLILEKNRSDQLLSSILPDFVIKMIQDLPKGVYQPDQMISKDFVNCTLLYLDIVDFTNLAAKVDPTSLVRLLNEVFSEFDRVVEENNCEKIKTDGDAYLCAGGLTIENEDHFQSIIESGLTILTLKILKENCLNVNLKLRVGVASGSVIGGVIGHEKFQFDVWGEAIAKAHILEETGVPGKIHISKSDLDKLAKDDYIIEECEQTHLGEKTYFIIPEPNATYVPSQQQQHSTEPSQQLSLQSNSINSVVSSDNSQFSSNSSNDSIPMNEFNVYSNSVNNSIKNEDVNIISTDNEISIIPTLSPDSSESTNNHNHDNVDYKDNDNGSDIGNDNGNGDDNKSKNVKELFNDILYRMGIKWSGTDHYTLSTTMRKDLLDVEKVFKDYTKFNRWIAQFGNWSVEKAYHEYVIQNTIIETRIFLFVGLFIHCIFFVDDKLMHSKSVYHAEIIYLIMLFIFAIYIAISFTRAFRKPVVYQLSFLILLVSFCVATIIEFIRYGNPLARSSITRLLLTLLYANLFYSLNFVFVTFLNILVFGLFLIFAFYVEPRNLPNHIYVTDYIGGFIVLAIQIYSSYVMKLGMRRIWILKSKIKFKGLNLKMERLKSSRLLENIMPDLISKQLLKETRRSSRLLIAQSYSKVAVMFINVIGFDQLRQSTETPILKYMNYIFTEFDRFLAKYDLEKIKTIGTTYMVVAGLTKNQGQLPKHYVGNLADMALTAKAMVLHTNSSLNVQIGINYGCLVAGCIGISRAKFDVWGDTANIASRMQTSSPPGKIQITTAVSNLLHDEFFIEERGIIPVKGRGEMSTYFLSGRRQQSLSYNSVANEQTNDHLPQHWYKKTIYQSPSLHYSLPSAKE